MTSSPRLQGYPPRDSKLIEYIYYKWTTRTDLEQQIQFAILLHVLFDRAAELAATSGKIGGALAASWIGYFNKGRRVGCPGQNKETFLDEVVEKAHLVSRL